MKINGIFTKACAYTMIVAGTLSSCTKKPFVKMPAENITKEVKAEIANYRHEAQEVLKDTSYAFYGKDTLLFDKYFKLRMNDGIRSNMEKVVVKDTMENHIFFSNNKMHIIPTRKIEKEDKFIAPRAIVRDSSVYTTDSVNIYLPVEYYGKPNPKAIPIK